MYTTTPNQIKPTHNLDHSTFYSNHFDCDILRGHTPPRFHNPLFFSGWIPLADHFDTNTTIDQLSSTSPSSDDSPIASLPSYTPSEATVSVFDLAEYQPRSSDQAAQTPSATPPRQVSSSSKPESKSPKGLLSLCCSRPGCSYKAGQHSDLEKHMFTHSDLQRYECTECGKSYKRYGDARKHAKDKHDGRYRKLVRILDRSTNEYRSID